jgi:hypothetical protein
MLDKLFGLDKSHKITDGDEVDLLTTVYDQGALAIVRSVLDAEKIPYLVRERGSGSMVKIVTGFTMYGTDVFVPADAKERASELLEALGDFDESQVVNEENPTEGDESDA